MPAYIQTHMDAHLNSYASKVSMTSKEILKQFIIDVR